MFYNRCIYKLGNNTYPRCIRHRSNLGQFFGEKKIASYGLGNTVHHKIILQLSGTYTIFNLHGTV